MKANCDNPAEEANSAMNSLALSLHEAYERVPERETPATLEAFLAQVERRAYRFAELQLRQREDAMDAVQDAMLRLVKSYRNRPGTEWAPLFWGILRRRVVDLQRRRKVRAIVLPFTSIGTRRSDAGDELSAWEPADRAHGPLENLHGEGAYQAMAAAVAELPQRQAQAFALRVLEGLDVADTARAMGCGEGSVKTHLSRALHRLREQLEDWQ